MSETQKWNIVINGTTEFKWSEWGDSDLESFCKIRQEHDIIVISKSQLEQIMKEAP